MLVIAILASTLQIAKIDFVHPAATVPIVLEALSEHAGIKLRAGAELKNEVLLLHLRHADWEQTKEKIAEVLSAEWEEKDGLLVLTRSPAMQRELRETDLEKVSNAYKDAMKDVPSPRNITQSDVAEVTRLLKEQAGGKELTEAEIASIKKASPVIRLARRLEKTIDTRTLLFRPPGEEIDLLFNTDLHDKRLPASVMKLADQFFQEAAVFSNALQRSGLGMAELQDYWREFPLDLEQPGKFGVHSTSHGADFMAAVRIYPKEEGWWYTQGLHSDAKWSRPPLMERRPEWDVQAKYSDLALEFANAPETRPLRYVPYEVSQELTDALIVDKVDPIHLGFYDALTQAAEASGKNLVAVITDYLINNARRYGASKNHNLNYLVPRLLIPTFQSVEFDEGFMTVKPLYPWVSSARRFDRESLADYLREGMKSGTRSALTLSALLNAESLVDPVTIDHWTCTLTRQVSLTAARRSDAHAMRIFSALEDVQKKRALIGWLALSRSQMSEKLLRSVTAASDGSAQVTAIRARLVEEVSLFRGAAVDKGVTFVQEFGELELVHAVAARRIDHWTLTGTSLFAFGTSEVIEVQLLSRNGTVTLEYRVPNLREGAEFFTFDRIPRHLFAGLEEKILEKIEELKAWEEPNEQRRKPPPVLDEY